MTRWFRQAWIIVRMAWLRNLNYRFTILMYRVGEIAEVAVLILMWTAVYQGSEGVIRGFTLNEMITYVLVGNLSAVAVRNFMYMTVSKDILDGRLSMFLVRPIPYFKFLFLNEIGRNFLTTLLSFVSQVVVTLFFLSKFIINDDPRYLVVLLAMVCLAFVIEALIGFLIGAVAFWTDEVDGLQSSMERIKRFFSGGYFPLTLLPTFLSTLSLNLPFAYSFFVPAALYLKKMSLAEGVHGLLVQMIWIFLLSLIVALVWKRGLRRYEATGS